jgi:hypothetical protein
MFLGKAMSLLYSGAPERSFTCVGSSLTNKLLPRLDKLAMNKHSSLIQTFINYGHKKVL